MVRALTRAHTRFTRVLRQRRTVEPSFKGAPDTNDWIRLVLPQRLPLVFLYSQVIHTLPLANNLSNQCVGMYITANFAVYGSQKGLPHSLAVTRPTHNELCFRTAKSCTHTTTHRSLMRLDMDLRLI